MISQSLFTLGTKAVARRCSLKKVFLEISQNSQENTCAGVSFLIKLQAGIRNFIQKEAVAQVFSCEFYTGWCPAGPVLPHGEKVPL